MIKQLPIKVKNQSHLGSGALCTKKDHDLPLQTQRSFHLIFNDIPALIWWKLKKIMNYDIKTILWEWHSACTWPFTNTPSPRINGLGSIAVPHYLPINTCCRVCVFTLHQSQSVVNVMLYCSWNTKNCWACQSEYFYKTLKHLGQHPKRLWSYFTFMHHKILELEGISIFLYIWKKWEPD